MLPRAHIEDTIPTSAADAEGLEDSVEAEADSADLAVVASEVAEPVEAGDCCLMNTV